jgi:MFS family permease
MRRSRTALLAALGIDSFGSGLFLPLALMYVTRIVGLPLAVAATVIALGSMAGVVVPPIAGRLVDRTGPLAIVIAAQALQALGAATYLVARGMPVVVIAAVLLAAGQQLFYSSLFALVSDVAGTGPKERPFAVAAMVRAAGFGFGGLVVGGLLTAAGPVGYRAAVAADALSFLACSLLMALVVRVPRQRHSHGGIEADPRRLLSDRPFLTLIAATGLIALTVDFFLVGIPVYVLVNLHAKPWLPGAILALFTALSSVGGTAMLRVTRRLSRIAAMQLGAAFFSLWCGACVAAILIPLAWQPAELLAATPALAAGALLFESRALALAEAAAPRVGRGRYLAAFQYAFTVAGVLAPATVALYSVAVWLPWLLVGTCAGLAIPSLRWLAGHLPPEVLRHRPVVGHETAASSAALP